MKRLYERYDEDVQSRPITLGVGETQVGFGVYWIAVATIEYRYEIDCLPEQTGPH